MSFIIGLFLLHFAFTRALPFLLNCIKLGLFEACRIFGEFLNLAEIFLAQPRLQTRTRMTKSKPIVWC